MSSSGSIPAAASPSVGAERRRSYGQLAVTSVPPPAKAEAWHARIPRWLVYGAGGLLVLGGAIFGLRSLVRPGTPIESQPPSPVAVQAAEEDVEEAPTALRTVQIEVTNLPQGARLVLDGLPAHDTPLRLREGTRHRLEITAPGYLPRTVEFEAAEGMRIPGALEPEPTQPRGRRR
jgi:hypothetical protein